MKEFTPKIFKTLFANLCCSQCRNDFDFEDFTEKEFQGNLLLGNLKCRKCGKNFGDVLLSYNRFKNTHNPLEIIEGYPKITTDDVIDAHEFIKKNL